MKPAETHRNGARVTQDQQGSSMEKASGGPDPRRRTKPEAGTLRLWPSRRKAHRVTPRRTRAEEGPNMAKASTRPDVPARNGRWKTTWKVGKRGSTRQKDIAMRCREQTSACRVSARSPGEPPMDLTTGEPDLDPD